MRNDGQSKIKTTHPLVVNDYDLFYASIPTELVVQVPLSAANTKTKNAKNTGGVRGLLEGKNL